MPLPTPTTEETQSEFIERCMGDAQAVADFPDEDQRLAVCFDQWRDGKAAASNENPTRLRLVSGAPVELLEKVEAEGDDGKDKKFRSFKMLAYTGQKVLIGMFGEPMVFDLAGMDI